MPLGELVSPLLERASGRIGAVALFVVALGVYWIEALAWPLQRGRDSWDYWLYYLQLADRHPPFTSLAVFRTPLTPLLTGIPMSLGGAAPLEIVLSLVYAAAVVGWAWAARPAGQRAAVATGLVVLALLPYAAMFHEVSSDFLFGALLAPWTGLVLRVWLRPTGRVLAALGLVTAALALTRPAGQILLLAAAAAAIAAAGAWRRRGKRLLVVLAAGIVPLLLWAVVNGIRYDDFTVARGGKAWVPFFKVLSLDIIAPSNGDASRRLTRAIERDVLTLPPYRRRHVDLRTYLATPNNLEAIRLIALADRDFGKGSNYQVLYDASLEAIRKHPGVYFHSVRQTFWHFIWFRFALEPVRRRAPPPPGPKTIVIGGKPRPSPEALSPLVQAARFGFVWCPTEAIDRCILRHPSVAFRDPAEARRYTELVGRVRDWNSQLPVRNGVGWLAAKLDTLSWREPAPFLWILVAAAAIALRRPRGWPALLAASFGAVLVLLVHALSQQPQAEYSIPLTPVFVLAAVVGIVGERGRAGRGDGSATVSPS